MNKRRTYGRSPQCRAEWEVYVCAFGVVVTVGFLFSAWGLDELRKGHGWPIAFGILLCAFSIPFWFIAAQVCVAFNQLHKAQRNPPLRRGHLALK